MSKVTIKKTLININVLLILSAFSFFCGCNGSDGKKFIVQKVSPGSVNKTVSAMGVIEVTDSVPILTKINGLVKKIYVKSDQRVRKGTLLAAMDSSEIRQKLLRVSTILESSRLNLQSAQQDFEGKKRMLKENLISRVSYEHAELEYKKAVNAHRLNRIDYDHLVQQKRNALIRAPISGVIIETSIKEKRLVRTNYPVFMMTSDLKKMTLIVSIDEADIGSVKEKLKVDFSVSAYPEKKFYGTIASVAINPVKKNGLVSYKSEVICDNSMLLLKPGMTATATIMVASKKNVLRVPNQAFMVTPDNSVSELDEKVLWLKKGVISGPSSFKKIEVVPGLAGDMFTEIKGNLKKGQQVLIKVEESDK